MRRAIAVVLLAIGCAGESITTTPEPCPVVLANPGPSAPGACFRAVAGEASTVRLAGENGSGEAVVDVPFGQSYEALACSESWGAPTLAPCAL